MGQRLTDRTVLALPAPDKGNKVYYDAPDRKGATRRLALPSGPSGCGPAPRGIIAR